ncbi:MAG: murein transglycosylase [Alphaproteobacteria bacterium]|nr:MAG: murein transglycosylase [Alphaproteobacteria bacterium]
MKGSGRAFVLLSAGLALLGILLWFLLVWLPRQALEPPQAEPLRFTKLSFENLAGWQADDLGAALQTFLRTCPRLTARADRPISDHTFPGTDILVAGRGDDWREICQHAEDLRAAEDFGAARSFFETTFMPFEVTGADPEENIFTGYYEPVLQGSLEKTDLFQVPLLKRPDDLVHVELGDFRESLKGQRIAGRVAAGRLTPYEDRAEIEAGRLGDKGVPLVYLSDPVDAFFTHIQGSARVHLTDGTDMRVNYDGQNGHPYTAIGAPLIRRGEIAREDMSMEAIRAWLKDHEENGAAELMHENASYIFFRQVPIENPELGPPGAAGIDLTPQRSLAVDRKYHALGLPVWIETSETLQGALPDPETGKAPSKPFHHLMVAQDTGGAIRGPARGDIFFGSGDAAGARAGAQNAPGRFVLLVPRFAARAYEEARAAQEAAAP